MQNAYRPGEWLAICDRCARQLFASELRDEWTGLKVCCRCWEPRHPSTLIHVPKDDPSVPWTRPEPADVFVGIDPLLTEDGSFISIEIGTLLTTET